MYIKSEVINQMENKMKLPEYVIDEIKILCNIVLENNTNVVDKNVAKTVLNNIESYEEKILESEK